MIGDLIAEFIPSAWHLCAQEGEDVCGELVQAVMTSVVADVAVHDAPEAFDRVEMGTINRDEMHSNAAIPSGKPLFDPFGMVMAGIVGIEMDRY